MNGGNCICFPGNMGTNTMSLKLVKLLLNSMLSCPGAWFSFIDLKNFYLDSPSSTTRGLLTTSSWLPSVPLLPNNHVLP